MLTRWLTRRRIMNGLTILAIFVSYWYGQHEGLRAIAAETHAGLCALRNDVQVRHDASVAYLKSHPLGVVSPKTGAIIITRPQIEQSIHNQESTLRAMDESGLTCEPPKETNERQ